MADMLKRNDEERWYFLFLFLRYFNSDSRCSDVVNSKTINIVGIFVRIGFKSILLLFILMFLLPRFVMLN